MEDDLLIRLVPPFGPRAEMRPLLAYLKLAPGAALVAGRSTLELVDEGGRVLATRENAFGVAEGTPLAGPHSVRLADDDPRPEGAASARWRLGELSAETPLANPEAEWPAPRLVCLELQVPVADDPHLVVTVANTGGEPLDIATGMREAVLRVDGAAYASTAGRVWNGPYLVRPGHVTTRQFSLGDFPGAPRSGTHQVSLEILGMRTAPQTVTWRGEPWPEGGG